MGGVNCIQTFLDFFRFTRSLSYVHLVYFSTGAGRYVESVHVGHSISYWLLSLNL